MADEQRTLALGLQSLVFRALGSIPGPIVFGVIFDSACLFWQFECDRRGNCWVYDNTALSNRALALAVSGVVLNLVFSFLTWLVYPRKQPDKDTATKTPEADNVESAEESAAAVKSVSGNQMLDEVHTSTKL